MDNLKLENLLHKYELHIVKDANEAIYIMTKADESIDLYSSMLIEATLDRSGDVEDVTVYSEITKKLRESCRPNDGFMIESFYDDMFEIAKLLYTSY